MFSVMTFVRKRADLSQEEFERYWREVHVPITLAHQPVRSYRVGVFRNGLDALERWDGWAILTYDDEDAWREDERSVESRISAEDVPNFLEELSAVVVDTHDYR